MLKILITGSFQWPSGFYCCAPGSIPGQGTGIPQAVRHGQKKNQKLFIKILNQTAGNTPINQRYSFKLSHLYNKNNNSVHLTGLFYGLNE